MNNTSGRVKEPPPMLYKSNSADETRRIAGDIAAKAAPGDIYCLTGELGAGKTVFAQGFAAGMNYNGDVTSPTFTLLHEYIGGRMPVYHFDLYRLERGDELEGLGYEEYFYGNGVCLIEWPERANGLIPEGASYIKITTDYDAGAEVRSIDVRTY
jgi:tRNA threonylcarbamoyladenosine biosynthesis protein TsaE